MVAHSLIAALSLSLTAGSTATPSSSSKPRASEKQPTTAKPVDLPMPPPPAPKKPAAVAPASPSEGPAKPKLLRIVALEVAVVGEIPERLRTAFRQALLAEVRKMEAVSVLSSTEIRDMLSLERERQLLGCSTDNGEACMAELAGALDVSESLSGELSLVGTKYTLTLRRSNLLRAQVAAKTRTFEKRDGEELLAVVGPLVAELFPERPLLPGKKRGVSAEVVQRLNPPPLPKWAFFTTAGASVAAGLAGGTFGFLSGQAASQHNTLAQNSVTAPVSGAQLTTLRQQATTQAQIANVAFIGAAALAVGAGVQFFFTHWQEGEAPKPVTLLPTGNGAALVGTF